MPAQLRHRDALRPTLLLAVAVSWQRTLLLHGGGAAIFRGSVVRMKDETESR